MPNPEIAASDAPDSKTTVTVVDALPVSSENSFYIGNRKPLVAAPLLKLPIGSIVPKGWLRRQLELEAQGMTGHLPEISKWCQFEGNAWAHPAGQGHSGWEELPYWLKGFGDLGYVLKDQRIIGEARRWIEAVLASQEDSGWFGPRSLKTSLKGQPDLWPHMVMLNVLQSFYEATNDPRVVPFMLRYHRWLNEQPATSFGNGYWPRIRFGDNLETAHWLFNRTGETWLLGLGKKIHENMQDWTTGVHNWHNVNISQGFREPAIYYLQSGDTEFLLAAERNYQQVMGIYGQFPGGSFAGDENCRPDFTDPRQGFETCGIIEFMHSFEMLTKLSGNPLWADRCEELAFNTLPAALTPDLKGLHYLTCANQIQLDRGNKAPAVENGGNMFAYSPFECYRCCQHNVSHGWPYYAEELWLATLDNGLAASLYAASEVTAKVGSGAAVTITEQTDYPFGDTVTLKVACSAAMNFPLYLRIPRWCDAPELKLNGKKVSLRGRPLTFVAVKRAWQPDDTLELRLPMAIKIRTWEKNHNAVSVDRGPLTYALKIGEKWVPYGGRNEAWPEWEVFPTTPWNYGLMIAARAPAQSFEVVQKLGPLPDNPFTPDTAPIELRAKARKIPAWQQDNLGMVGKLQPSPVRSNEPVETVSLIPMGAARLRISAFPVIGAGAAAHDWAKPAVAPLAASHCWQNDTLEAVIDGLAPKSSNDHTIPRFTWWDHRGTAEWIEWGFPQPRKVSAVEVYWFDDRPTGSCRAPQNWKLFYRVGEVWQPVQGASEFGTALDKFNRTTFNPVQANGLKIEVQLQPGVSAGILEWRASE